MDAVQFLKENNRMMMTDEKAFIEANKIEDYGGYVAAVEKWAKEHPCKTILSDFLKKIS